MFFSKPKLPIRKRYDAVVVGTGLSGLVSGGLLAKRGLEVLVVHQEQSPLAIAHGGFSLQRKSVTAQGFKRYLFEALFEELGLKPHERSLFERAQPVFQVIDAKHRIDVTANREALLEEYRREFPKSLDAIIRFYQELDRATEAQDGAFGREDLGIPLARSKKMRSLAAGRGRRPLAELFESLQLPFDFRRLLVAQVSFLSHVHTETPTFAQAQQVLATTQRKDYFFLGDARDLAQIFFDRILQSGGAVREDTVIEQLLPESRQIAGAKLSSYEGVIGADLFIGNVNARRLYGVIEPCWRLRGVGRVLARNRPSFAKCNFYIAVSEGVLPVGLKDSAVLIGEPTRPFLGENFIEIGLSTRRDGQNPHQRMIHVSFYLPFPGDEKAAEGAFQTLYDKTCEAVLARLNWLIPFLSKHQLFRFPEAGGFATSSEGQGLERFALMHGIYAWPGEGHSNNPFGFFPNETPFRNLFFTGPEVLPALGFEGEIISGIQAAGLAQARYQAAQAQRSRRAA